MIKSIYLAILPAMMLILASCGNGQFNIEGNLNDAGTQNLRFVYATDGSINSIWIPSVGGKFSMQGNSKDLTVVYIYSSKMKFITHLAVKNGDKITIDGSIKDNYNLNVSGSEVAEQWNGFIRQNAAAFSNGNTAQTDREIAAFVESNPSNVVSTLLLTCDYSDISSPAAAKLLQTIDEKARPQQLTELYGYSLQTSMEKEKPITPLNLRNEKDSLEILDTKNATNILYFWLYDSETRKENIRKLKEASKKNSKKVKISDIFMSYDTLSWKKTIKADSVAWRHYKAFTGVADKTIESLNVKGDNYIIVADSAGKQIYRGFSVDEAIKTAGIKP